MLYDTRDIVSNHFQLRADTCKTTWKGRFKFLIVGISLKDEQNYIDKRAIVEKDSTNRVNVNDQFVQVFKFINP